MAAIDVKTAHGDTRSLDSCAVFEKDVDLLVKISREPPALDPKHVAQVVSLGESRQVPLAIIPHYLCCRLQELCAEVFLA